MRVSLVLLACLAFPHHARRVYLPEHSDEIDSVGRQANTKAFAKLLDNLVPASAFSTSSAGVRAPLGKPNRADALSNIRMAESWKDYLTRAVATLEDIEAKTKAMDARPEPEPLMPVKVFDSESYAEAKEKYNKFAAEESAAAAEIKAAEESAAEISTKLLEEIEKLKAIAGEDLDMEEGSSRPSSLMRAVKADIDAAQGSLGKLQGRLSEAERSITVMEEEPGFLPGLTEDEGNAFRSKLGSTLYVTAKVKTSFPDMALYMPGPPDETKEKYMEGDFGNAPIWGYNAAGKFIKERDTNGFEFEA